ncbi:hypothetical protein AGDE_12602 [Angomonas deanei]|nr:hypothetical protein AGDE_12602 [Angomonas deanei]|eukprot:EPY23964.1 hypothetical protein AGDE_12602 [Angomonas deanei]
MHKVKIGPNTHAVCVVEYIVERQEEPVCLGHCCIPINKTSYTGSFLTRLKLGDPRRSQERDPEDGRPVGRVVDEQQRLTKNYEQQQLELSVDSQFLRNVLPANPASARSAFPCPTSSGVSTTPTPTPLTRRHLGSCRSPRRRSRCTTRVCRCRRRPPAPRGSKIKSLRRKSSLGLPPRLAMASPTSPRTPRQGDCSCG